MFAFALTCAALQVLAYQHSALTSVVHPYECLAIPHGACPAVMASGYADTLGSFGARWNLEEVVAAIVPLWMWIAVVYGIHGPALRSRATIVYGAAFAVALVWGAATQLRHQPGAEPVP